jgi:uncharacterized protein YegP (UPF0339 family)
MAKFVLFQDDEYNQFRWILKDDRGNVIAQAPAGFMSYEECDKAVRNIKVVSNGATILDETPSPGRRRIPKPSPR